MLRMALAPCAPFNVTAELMLKAARLARQYTGVRLHTHLAENQEDIDFSQLQAWGLHQVNLAAGLHASGASADPAFASLDTTWSRSNR